VFNNADCHLLESARSFPSAPSRAPSTARNTHFARARSRCSRAAPCLSKSYPSSARRTLAQRSPNLIHCSVQRSISLPPAPHDVPRCQCLNPGIAASVNFRSGPIFATWASRRTHRTPADAIRSFEAIIRKLPSDGKTRPLPQAVSRDRPRTIRPSSRHPTPPESQLYRFLMRLKMASPRTTPKGNSPKRVCYQSLARSIPIADVSDVLACKMRSSRQVDAIFRLRSRSQPHAQERTSRARRQPRGTLMLHRRARPALSEMAATLPPRRF